MTDWSDADYAQAALDMLPDTPEEIAEFFRVQGISGERGKCDTCPVAQWVTRWTGTNVWVGSWVIGDAPRALRTWSMNMPTSVGVFISRFDTGKVTL